MYRGFGETWRGFAKNAFEGLGSLGLLVFITVYHALGQVLPWIVVALALSTAQWSRGASLAAGAIGCALLLRTLLAARFRQSWWNVPLHVVAILVLAAVQWRSLWLDRTGRRSWRGRTGGAGAIRPSAGS